MAVKAVLFLHWAQACSCDEEGNVMWGRKKSRELNASLLFFGLNFKPGIAI